MTRRQVRRMIRHESVITALIGGAIGIALGIVLGGAARGARRLHRLRRAVGHADHLRDRDDRVGIVAAIFPARRAVAAERAPGAAVRVTRDELATLLAGHEPADDEEARDLETMRGYAVTLADPVLARRAGRRTSPPRPSSSTRTARARCSSTTARAATGSSPAGTSSPATRRSPRRRCARRARRPASTSASLAPGPARRRRALDPVGRALPPRPALPRRRVGHARAGRRRGARGGVADVGRRVRADRRAGAAPGAREGAGARASDSRH